MTALEPRHTPFTSGNAHKGKKWAKVRPNGRMWGMYIEQWRKPNGEVDVHPCGTPNQSFTFHISELLEVVE